MDGMNDVSDARLKAYVLISAIGVAVILLFDFGFMLAGKGIEHIRMIEWF